MLRMVAFTTHSSPGSPEEAKSSPISTEASEVEDGDLGRGVQRSWSWRSHVLPSQKERVRAISRAFGRPCRSHQRGSFTAENAVGVVEANLAIDEEFEQAETQSRF